MMQPDSNHIVLNASSCGVWYLAYCKPRSETMALKNLLIQGYEAWLPRIKRLANTTDRMKEGLHVMEPMFPRYVLFRPSSAAQSISPARSTLGVSKVVTLGQLPGTLTHPQAVELARMEQEQHSLSGNDVAGFKVGMPVMVREGPFKGLNAVVHLTAQERVFLLVQLLGKEHKVSFPIQHVRAE